MEEDPIEQQKNKLRNEMRTKFSSLFDDKDKLREQIERFESQADVYEKHGLLPNKEEVIQGLKQSLEIQKKEVFIPHLIKIMEPFVLLPLTKRALFAKAERENTFKDKNNLQLSEILYIRKPDLNKDAKDIYIHLPSAWDFMTKEKKDEFVPEIKKGFAELANMLKSYPNIEEVRGSSWLIATKFMKRLEELGFTYDGLISEKEYKESFIGEERPIAKAFIGRGDFLARYGTSEPTLKKEA
ncbi:MAG TPA: hypothetical protein VGO63_00885 [Candidatus Paceibacterota bacterium]|jgi:hypothetical protein|nr:hypothetical protein [Candidatus Paceibacterota bacterium]